MLSRVALFLFFLLGVTLFPSPAKSISVDQVDSTGSYSWNFFWEDGLIPTCTICDSPPGAYACSNQVHFNNGSFLFTDATPVGSVPTKIEVDIFGSYTCNGLSWEEISVSVSGYLVNMAAVDGNDYCACGTCDGMVHLETEESNKSLPLKLRGPNVIQVVNYLDVSCLSSMNMTVYYQVEPITAPAKRVTANFSSGGEALRSDDICSRTIYHKVPAFFEGSLVYSFQDPVPANKVVVSVSVRLFGRYIRDYTSELCFDYERVLLSMTLGRITLTNTFSGYRDTSNPLYYNAPCEYTGCDGGWRFDSGEWYSLGWPGYNYSDVNYLEIFNGGSTSPGPGIAFVLIELSYQ